MQGDGVEMSDWGREREREEFDGRENSVGARAKWRWLGDSS